MLLTYSSSLRIPPSLFPNVDVPSSHSAAFFSVKTPSDHGEHLEVDGMKENMSVMNRANPYSGAGRGLHPWQGRWVVVTVHGLEAGDLGSSDQPSQAYLS